MYKSLHRLKGVNVGEKDWLKSGAAHRNIVSLDPFAHSVTSRVKSHAGNSFMAMFNQVAHALFRAFPIFYEHSICSYS